MSCMTNTATPEFIAAQKAAADMRRDIGEQRTHIDELSSGGQDTRQAVRELAAMQATHLEAKAHHERMREDGASFRTRPTNFPIPDIRPHPLGPKLRFKVRKWRKPLLPGPGEGRSSS